MRAILISIKPRWLAKILNGEKTIEIRKTCPEIFKHLKPYEGASLVVYIYCTKTKYVNYAAHLEGKVVAKFTLNKVEEIRYTPRKLFDSDSYYLGNPSSNILSSLLGNPLYEKSCLSKDKLHKYLKGKKGYAWHISNLVIFDEPKELSEFWHYKRFDCYNADFDYTEIEYRQIRLTRAPQSWCYVEVEKQ